MKRLVVAMGVAAAAILVPGVAFGQYEEPGCELNTGHFLVNGAVVYIKNASQERDSTKRNRMLEDARRNLVEAVQRGEEENAAVWYFLGRYYEMTGDVAGTDSTFARAVELQPECAEDISYRRQRMWVPIMNAALDSLRVGDFEGAKRQLGQANTVYDGDNIGFYYLGRILANQAEPDSALKYFRKVVELGRPADTNRVRYYEESILYTATVYGMQGQFYDAPELWDSAAAWYVRYRELYPNDREALTGLAEAYAEAAKAYERIADEVRAAPGVSAQALAEERASILEAAGARRAREFGVYDTIIANAEYMDGEDLFRVGARLFLADSLRRATDAFRKGLVKNPYSRHGLYNLVNTYLAVANDDETPAPERQSAAREMEGAARRLVALDPHSTEVLRLLAAAFQLQQKDDSTEAVLNRIAAMSFDVVVELSQAQPGGFIVQGRVKNARDSETRVPRIKFEFLDADGKVVATETVAPLTLAPNDAEVFGLTPQGEAIMGWRYTVGA